MGPLQRREMEAVVRERLADAERNVRSLDDELAALAAERAAGVADDEHDPEGVPLSGEWSRLHGLREAARAERAGLQDALRRLETGAFGRCRDCGRPIPLERLRIRPASTRCVACAERAGH